MQKTRNTGVRRSPDSEAVLSKYWLRVIEEIGNATDLIIGGKSLGGRISSMIADDAGVRGLVCLGYPFHPPGKPERLRTAHLIDIKTPTLVLQGTRDAFGSREEVVKYGLSPQIKLVFIEDGDHSFKPSTRSGRTEKQNLDQVISEISGFVKSI
jgi:predicted alpha/beta-hydrolase family hydrolase